jgi:predicted dehydrogenase
MSYQRDYQNRLKIGLVGVGSHAYRNILPALHYLPVRLQAVCDINLDLARKTAEEYGSVKAYATTAEMYRQEKLDAVLICVSPQLHPSLACEAFAANLHVWLEKPAAMFASEVEEMIRHRQGKICVVGFKKAFMPVTGKAIQLLEKKEYQPISSIVAQYPVLLPPDGKDILKERKFTDWLGNGCHPLSMMVALGGKVESVVAHRSPGGAGICILRFANGMIGNLHADVGAGSSQPSERYTIYGNKVTLSIENSSRLVLQRGVPFAYGKSVSYLEGGEQSGAVVWEPQNTLATLENKALFSQGMFAELDSFCRQAQSGQLEWIGSLEFALEVMKIYEAALRSDGKTVTLK